MSHKFSLSCLLILCFCTTYSQQKQITISRAAAAPKIDGKLDDAAWNNAAVATGFIVNFPDYGKPATQDSYVKIIYDDEAIYIGAFLKDDPSLIRRQLTQRDNEQFQDADNFGVAFDTYNDKQNAFRFIVTTANVQSDLRISATEQSSNGESNGGFDYNWDAVWDSRTTIVADGWIAEIKIPYSAIRFPKEEIQKWGVNFSRYIRRLNETSYWSPIDPKQSGFVNQFGLLNGIQNIEPPLRLSFLPYLSGGYSTVPSNEGRINDVLYNGGMDVKYGINESFTMDMTLVPDFGQVQSDNVILNLTPFEQKFNENRPFFTEGTELFNKAEVFYSRRIGAIPTGYYNALQLASDSGFTIKKNPAITRILNATKFSGRTKKGLGIGVLNAVTSPMHASFERSDGSILTMQTEPLTNYNIFVLDQTLKNRSYITFTNTNVIRNGSARDANVSALDLSLYDKSNTYNFKMQGAFSYVAGNDPHNGYLTSTSFEKQSGRWQWGVYDKIKSQAYDPNDFGILYRNNEWINGASLSYNQFTPNNTFNFRNYNVSIEYTNRLVPMSYTQVEVLGNFLHVFKNFWDITLVTQWHPFWDNNYYDLRTAGRYVKTVPYAFLGLRGSTDSRKKLFGSYFLGYANFSPIPDDPFTLVNLGLRYRFGPKFSVSLEGERTFDKGNSGFALFDPVTSEPVIGLRQITQFTSLANAIYNFKARMSLNVRLRHYWSKVHYTQFFDVLNDGKWSPRSFVDGEDENFNTFNLDMFFSWDFRLGSRLILAWKNALGPDAYISGADHKMYGSNFTQVFNIPHSNEVSIKFVYYIDAQQFANKKINAN